MTPVTCGAAIDVPFSPMRPLRSWGIAKSPYWPCLKLTCCTLRPALALGAQLGSLGSEASLPPPGATTSTPCPKFE